jgi:hypothetical protein
MDGPVLVSLGVVVSVGMDRAWPQHAVVSLVVVVLLGGGARAGNNMQEGSFARERGEGRGIIDESAFSLDQIQTALRIERSVVVRTATVSIVRNSSCPNGAFFSSWLLFAVSLACLQRRGECTSESTVLDRT